MGDLPPTSYLLLPSERVEHVQHIDLKSWVFGNYTGIEIMSWIIPVR